MSRDDQQIPILEPMSDQRPDGQCDVSILKHEAQQRTSCVQMSLNPMFRSNLEGAQKHG
jgi:hypothetical protein